MSKPTANEDDPRAQPAAVGAWDNYVDPHPDAHALWQHIDSCCPNLYVDLWPQGNI